MKTQQQINNIITKILYQTPCKNIPSFKKNSFKSCNIIL